MIQTIKNIFNSQFYAISLYARQAAGAIVLLLITRLLTVHEYGLLKSYEAIIIFCLMFANLGFSEYILVSAKNDIDEIKQKIVFFLHYALSIAILLGITGIFIPLESKLIFLLILISGFLDSTFFGLIFPYFQASKRFNVISWINIFYSVMTVLIAVVSFLFKVSLAKFLFMCVLLGFFNFLLCSFYAQMNYKTTIQNLKNIFSKVDVSIFSYMAVTLCWYLYNRLPSIFTSISVTKENAALYFAAFTIANIISVFITAQVQKIVPEMISADIDKIKQLIKNNLKLIIGVTVFVFLFFALCGKSLLGLLYGKEYYENAYPILLILILSNIFIGIAAIYGAYITASGNQNMKIRMQIEAIFITILVLAIFSKFGIYAATGAYFLSAVHIGIRYTLLTKKLIKKNFYN